jgi:hypothetical protein
VNQSVEVNPEKVSKAKMFNRQPYVLQPTNKQKGKMKKKKKERKEKHYVLIDTNHGTVTPPVVDFNVARRGISSFRIDLDVAEPCAHAIGANLLSVLGEPGHG